MVTNLAPAKPPAYVKVANYPGLYRHSRSGRYYGCKKLHGVRRERSLDTCDRKIAERRLKAWIGSMDKVDAEVEKTTLGQLIQRYVAVTASLSESSRANDQSVIKRFLAWWPHGRDFQVRQVRPSMLDEWLAHEAPRLRNVSYNGYAGLLRQLFDVAVKDRIIAESPAKSLRVPWKKPQAVRRIIPTISQFEAIVASIRSQQYADTAQATGDFVEFLGLAGLGQAEASSLTWGDIDWQRNRLNIRRHKTDTHFYVPIYEHLRPLLQRLQKERRGRLSASALVFQIKDAKKALAAACKRLNLPPFSQRNLRQCLIVRLMRAGVNVKLIAKWQGHQDGGQLIMDTYTEALGADDDEYERAQLAKVGGGNTPVALLPGSQADEAISKSMKKSKMRPARPRRAKNALGATVTDSTVASVQTAADPAESVPNATAGSNPVAATAGESEPLPAAPAENPYRKGDKVKTKCKGQDVEAEVTNVWKDEVQVRTPDRELRWRTIRTVQLVNPPRALVALQSSS